jgi:WD40 repeat protein
MPDAIHTPGAETPVEDFSPDGVTDLCGLLDGLDLLDQLLHLPAQAGAEGDVGLGRFRLRRRLGSGRYGVVFLADDPVLQRRVVVKVPQPGVLADPELRARFAHEATAAARLEHPGIVPVYDSGEDRGLIYLAVGFVDGPTLAEWLAAHPNPPPRMAARLVELLAQALHHAHDRGVLHCDLKPGNILMHPATPGEVPEPVVTDFGMARILTDNPARSRTFHQAGTPLYMSPEQARGDRRALTARADVYALGVILYELLTGRTPFIGESGLEILERVQGDPTPCPGAANPDVPRDLRAVCRRCMEKDPRDRYASAADLAEDLGRFLGGYPVKARRLRPLTRAARWAGRNPLGTAAVVVITGLLAGFGAFLADWWTARVQHAADLKVAAAHLKVAEVEWAEAEERARAGEFIDTFNRIRQRREDQDPDWPALNLAELRRMAAPHFLHDLAQLRTEVAAALGGVDLGTPRAVGVGFMAYNPAFSPDGSTLALGAWLQDGGGTCSVLLLDPCTGAQRRTLHYPADPDWERRYAAAKQKPPGSYDGCRSLTYSPDGRWLVLGTRSGWLVRWDLNERDPAPVRWRHAPPSEYPYSERVNQLAFTPNGRVLVSTDGRRLVAWDARRGWSEVARAAELDLEIVRPARADDPLWVRAGQTLRPVSTGKRWLTAPDPIPFDGHQPVAAPGGELLFAHRGDGSVFQPYSKSPGGGRAAGEYANPFVVPGDRRTEDETIDDLAVSPDGLYLATASEHIGHLKLWAVASGQLLSARTLGEGSLRLAFSPDGRTLAVCEQSRTLLYTIAPSRVAATAALQPHRIADAAVAGDEAALLCRFGNDLAVADDLTVTHRTRLNGPPGWAAVKAVTAVGRPVGASNKWRVSLAPDGNSFAYTLGENVFWATPTATSGPGLRPAAFLRDLHFGPDRRLWVAAESFVGWGSDGSELRVSLTGRESIPPRPVSLAAGPSAVLAGRSDGAVSRIDPTTGAVDYTVEVFENPVTGIGLSGDGARAVAGSASGAVRVFRADTGELLIDRPTAHRDAVTAVAFGPGGWFATGSRDRLVKIWDPTGREVLTLPQTRPVRRVFWSADGRTLTTLAEGERGLRRWDLAALKTAISETGLDPMLP